MIPPLSLSDPMEISLFVISNFMLILLVRCEYTELLSYSSYYCVYYALLIMVDDLIFRSSDLKPIGSQNGNRPETDICSTQTRRTESAKTNKSNQKMHPERPQNVTKSSDLFANWKGMVNLPAWLTGSRLYPGCANAMGSLR
jgi:hypothetical protein